MYDLKLMEDAYDKFFHHVYKMWNEHDISIMDLGCGTGRDAVRFKEMGMEVHLVDFDVNKLVSAYHTVLSLTGEEPDGIYSLDMVMDMGFVEKFNAVWANACIHHIVNLEWGLLFDNIWSSLKDGGIFYFSLKEGTGESYDEYGRYFNYNNDSDIMEYFTERGDFGLLEKWREYEYRKNDRVTNWLNYILIK